MGSIVVDTRCCWPFLIPAMPTLLERSKPFGKSVPMEAESSFPPVRSPTSWSERVGVSAAAVRTTEAFVDSVVDAIHDIDRRGARAAATYRARYATLRLPDALIIAVGSVVDADAVLTADRRWTKADRRVLVIR